MFNRERFHNELAMRLGYNRIVNETGIQISVDESDDPWITLKEEGHDDIRFKASGNAEIPDSSVFPNIQNDVKEIADVVHQAYLVANNSRF